MADREAVRRGYDELEERYAHIRSEDGRDIDILDRFLASLSEPERVLDAGCGPGAPILRELAAATPTAIGLDFSREQLRLASSNAPRSPLVQGDMTALPFAADSVDAVTALHSLIHVPNDEQRSVLEEFARVLCPGGRMLLTDGPGEWCGSNLDWLESDTEMQWEIAGVDVTRDQLRNTGFTVTDEWDYQPVDSDEQWVFLAARLETQ